MARLGQIVHLCIEKDGLGFQIFKRRQRYDYGQ